MAAKKHQGRQGKRTEKSVGTTRGVGGKGKKGGASVTKLTPAQSAKAEARRSIGVLLKFSRQEMDTLMLLVGKSGLSRAVYIRNKALAGATAIARRG